MAIPSGGGTEVLKRAIKGANNDAWFVAIDGVANHIYTVLSIIITEVGGADETYSIRILQNGSSAAGDEVEMIKNQVLPSNSTFVFSDRIVLSGTDHLEIYNTPGNCDIIVSYIDQDWT
tara:strand:- start:141 stop:497 length:357 start_codon:yes stop_codon:yes gene_type:complete